MGKETETKERRILNGTGHEKRTRERPEVCPVAKKCGGCQMQGVPYEKQLEKKRALVRACVEHVKNREQLAGFISPLLPWWTWGSNCQAWQQAPFTL